MKVSGSGPTTGSSGPGPKARPGAGFAVGAPETAREAQASARAAAPASIGSVDALVALQGAEDDLSRRRRAVGRAGRLLDLMDEVKVALLGGESGAVALTRLGHAVREARIEVEDPKLEAILAEIETRAAVELAKRKVGLAA